MKKTERKLESIKKLEKLTEKPRDSWIFKYFYRKISIYFTKLFLYLGISANQVSIISGSFGALSIPLFMLGDYHSSVIGGILFFLYEMFDCSDGQVARYNIKKRNIDPKENLKGQYTDTVMGIFNLAVFMGLAFANRAILGDLALILGFSAVLSIGHWRTLLWQRQYLTKSTNRKPSITSISWVSPILVIFSSGMIAIAVLIGSLLNILHLILLFYGITLPIFMFGVIMYRFHYGLEKSRRMS